MPPRRKASSKSAAEPKAKKLKKQDSIEYDDKEVLWQWEADGNVWTSVTAKVNSKLNEAYTKSIEKIEYEVAPGVEMIADLNRGTQKNKKTGYERRLRIALKKVDTGDKKFSLWEWQDESNNWNPYPPCTSVTLHEVYVNDEHGDVEYVTDTIVPKTYLIDIHKKRQKCKETGFSRKIRRIDLPDSMEIKVEEEDDKEEVKPSTSNNGAGDAPATKSGRGKAAKSGKSAAKSGKSGGKATNSVEEETKSVVRKMVKKGEAPVDDECPIAGKTHVFSESKVVWDCMLNQTNVGNNNNKYYLIQILEEDGKNVYYCWQRWGRVGYKGQNNLVPCGGNLLNAKNVFTKKFKDKTCNDWQYRDSFEKIPGKYDLLAMDYDATDGKEDEVDAAVPSLKTEDSDKKIPDSTLSKPLQDLVQLICDIKSMEEAVMEMKYDAKKAPLGKLTQTQIKAGYAALKVIEGLIDSNKMGQALVEACNDFYTRIPHDFGFKTPPTIRTKPQVKEKLQLLEALGDIEIAIKILKTGNKDENPVDRHYHSLNCNMDALDKKHPDFKICTDYLQTTHATTHNQYKMELLEVFKCEKIDQDKQFIDHGNRMLLWHGSRLTNWVGILSQGLRIAPPEAPVTGYMFGKGVYFADMSSKSANYCFTSKAKNIGLLLLCEVSLGNVNTLLNADYKADKLPVGKHSVLGAGRVAPDPKGKITMSDGVTVPIGKGMDTKVINNTGYTLNYNEYIVYDTKQIKMKYLLKVKFNYK